MRGVTHSARTTMALPLRRLPRLLGGPQLSSSCALLNLHCIHLADGQSTGLARLLITLILARRHTADSLAMCAAQVC